MLIMHAKKKWFLDSVMVTGVKNGTGRQDSNLG